MRCVRSLRWDEETASLHNLAPHECPDNCNNRGGVRVEVEVDWSLGGGCLKNGTNSPAPIEYGMFGHFYFAVSDQTSSNCRDQFLTSIFGFWMVGFGESSG